MSLGLTTLSIWWKRYTRRLSPSGDFWHAVTNNGTGNGRISARWFYPGDTSEMHPRSRDGDALTAQEMDKLRESGARVPKKIVVVTSIRDVGGDDGVGTYILKEDGSTEPLEGSLERLIEATSPNGSLYGLIEIAGVITDDTPTDVEKGKLVYDQDGPAHTAYTPLPVEANGDGGQADHGNGSGNGHRKNWWIIRPGLFRPLMKAGKIVNIPSDWRHMPNNTTEERDARSQAKRNWEMRIERRSKEWGADIILSDHVMALFQYLHRSPEYGGRVINIHPGITDANDPDAVRGPTPTKDALERFASGHGDLHRVGATLHFVNDHADDGERIAELKLTGLSIDDEPRHVRWRNYSTSKNPVLISGLRYLALNFEPLIAASRRALKLDPPLQTVTPWESLGTREKVSRGWSAMREGQREWYSRRGAAAKRLIDIGTLTCVRKIDFTRPSPG